jgi:hypothetical protein
MMMAAATKSRTTRPTKAPAVQRMNLRNLFIGFEVIGLPFLRWGPF